MKSTSLLRGKHITAVLVALLACLVACTLAVSPQSAYAANSGNLTAGTVETSAVKAPAKGAVSSIASKKAGAIIVNAAAVKGASGYQFRIGLNAKMTMGAKQKTTTARSFTFANCAQGYKYYVKVRAYKKVNGKTVFGAWSALKTVIVKGGSKSAICKSRMAGWYIMFSSTRISDNTLIRKAENGVGYIALLKGNKLYSGVYNNGTLTWAKTGPYTWSVKSTSTGLAKKSGYYNVSMKVSAAYLTIQDKKGKYVYVRMY